MIMMNLKKVISDGDHEDSTGRSIEKPTTPSKKVRFQVDFTNAQDPDILAMPVISFHQSSEDMQLKSNSQLAEGWHLISRDILSPLGGKHRAIAQQPQEKEKTPRKFAASSIIEKQLRKKREEAKEKEEAKEIEEAKEMAEAEDNAEIEEKERYAAQERMINQKKRLTWLARSSSSPRKNTVLTPFISSSLEALSEPVLKSLTLPSDSQIEIPARKKHKTTGDVLNQQLLNQSWDHPPITSLWEMLEAEGLESPKLILKPSSSVPRRRISLRNFPPPEPKFVVQSPSNMPKGGAVRRKSCECLQCGGISNLELRTAHMYCEFPRAKNLRVLPKEFNHLFGIETSQEKKRGSSSTPKTIVKLSNFSGLKSQRNASQSSFGNAFTPTRPQRTSSNKGRLFGEEESPDRNSLRPREWGSDRTPDNREEELKSSKRVSLISVVNSDENSPNHHVKIQEAVALAFGKNRSNGKSQLSSMDNMEKEAGGGMARTSSNPRKKGEGKREMGSNLPLMKYKTVEERRAGVPEQEDQKKRPHLVKTNSLFEIVQERLEESPVGRKTTDNAGNKMYFHSTNLILEKASVSAQKQNSTKTSASPIRNNKLRNLSRCKTPRETLSSDRLRTSNTFQQSIGSPRNPVSEPQQTARDFLTTSRIRTAATPTRKVPRPSAEKESPKLTHKGNYIIENNEEIDVLPRLSQKDEQVLRIYRAPVSNMKQHKPSEPKSNSPSPLKNFFGTQTQGLVLKTTQKEHDREEFRLNSIFDNDNQQRMGKTVSRSGFRSTSQTARERRLKGSDFFDSNSRVDTLPVESQKSQSTIYNATSREKLALETDRELPPGYFINIPKIRSVYSSILSKPAFTKSQRRSPEKTFFANKSIVQKSAASDNHQ